MVAAGGGRKDGRAGCVICGGELVVKRAPARVTVLCRRCRSTWTGPLVDEQRVLEVASGDVIIESNPRVEE